MPSTSAFAATAALIGDPARACMLASLMDGRALTAGELARAAGVTPQTASGHLGQLTQGGLLAMERQGRSRYHRIASPAVARMLEGIMSVSAATPRTPTTVGPRDREMRRARTCYDHLAGEIAVAIADRMQARGEIVFTEDAGALTEEGARFLGELGANLEPRTSRIFCRPCLDWSERRPHIAGHVGAALCDLSLRKGWLHRRPGTRALAITPIGAASLHRHFGVSATG